jgi:hypothetical protein
VESPSLAAGRPIYSDSSFHAYNPKKSISDQSRHVARVDIGQPLLRREIILVPGDVAMIGSAIDAGVFDLQF